MTKDKRSMKIQDLKTLTSVSDPQISPLGDRFLFVETKVNDKDTYESHLYSQSLKTNELSQWTFGESTDHQPRFSPDGSKVIFTSNRSGVQQLWLLHLDGGEAKQLTTFKHGVSDPHWAKDGQSIFFSAPLDSGDDVATQVEVDKAVSDEEQKEKSKQPIIINRLKHKSDAGGFHDQKKNQLVKLDLNDHTFTQLTFADTNHTFEDVSPDNNLVLYSANLNDEADYEQINDLYTLNLTTDEHVKVTTQDGAYRQARFSPNGRHIACFGHDYTYAGATLNELYVIDLETFDRHSLTEHLDKQLGDAMISDSRLGNSNAGPIWSEDGESLFFIATDAGATGLYEAKRSGEINKLYQDNSHVFGFTYHDHTKSFILGISTPTNPGSFHLLNNDGDMSQLIQSNDRLMTQVRLVEPEEVTITAEDGWHIQGWLMKPSEFDPNKQYPFVLNIHGGPHAMYGQTFFHEMQVLAAQGYVVLYTNPRGSHGYGQAFVDAVRSDYGGKDYTDLMTAVDYALEHYDFIDQNRLGVTGGSYGGFMTNWIVGQTNRFKAAVTQRSITNWLSFYGVSDIGYFFTKWELGVDLLDDPDALWHFSPLKHVKNIDTPLLILHGEQDLRCPIEQAEQLFVALRHLRKEVEFVRFPGATHELSRSGDPDMRIERLNHMCRWFELYL